MAEIKAEQTKSEAVSTEVDEEEEIKKKAVEDYIRQQEAEKAAEKAAKEEELKKQAIAEYLAQQEAEKTKTVEKEE